MMDGYETTWELHLVPVQVFGGSYGNYEIGIHKTSIGGFAGGTEAGWVYKGRCKSINELKKIMSLVGI